jgi:hypothetical protein
MTSDEMIAKQPDPELLAEMRRIRNLFATAPGDKEDLITYAKEVVRPRTATEAGMGDALIADAKVQAKTAVAIAEALADQDVELSPPQMLYVAMKALEAALAALPQPPQESKDGH